MTPDLGSGTGEGRFGLSFWNFGDVALSASATLHVLYSCNGGSDWSELYVFPGEGETEDYAWYEETVWFSCPASTTTTTTTTGNTTTTSTTGGSSTTTTTPVSTTTTTTTLQSPAAPGNLVATGVSVSEIDLTWQDNSDNENGFHLERKDSLFGSWQAVSDPAPDAESYPDQGLACASRYYYRVRAYNGAGDSPNSNTSDAWTWTCQTTTTTTSPPTTTTTTTTTNPPTTTTTTVTTTTSTTTTTFCWDNGDETASCANGKMWTIHSYWSEVVGCSWNCADQRAADLTLGGYSDWRLPTVAELEAMYDPNRDDLYLACGSYDYARIASPIVLDCFSVWSSEWFDMNHIYCYIFLDWGGIQTGGSQASEGFVALAIRDM